MPEEIPSLRTTNGPIQQVAVEWLIPMGPRTMYGLLGAELQSKPKETLRLEVYSTSPEGESYVDTIASKISEDARISLPKEYVASVLKGASEACGNPSDLSGTLQFNCAVHGLVGSSEAIFKDLARIVVEVFSLPELLSEEALKPLFQFN